MQVLLWYYAANVEFLDKTIEIDFLYLYCVKNNPAARSQQKPLLEDSLASANTQVPTRGITSGLCAEKDLKVTINSLLKLHIKKFGYTGISALVIFIGKSAVHYRINRYSIMIKCKQYKINEKDPISSDS